MARVTSLRGPIESEQGEFVLRIPLAAGGTELVAAARGIGEVDGDVLRIVIPRWLAEKIRVEAGTVVNVDNDGGKLNIQRVG